MKYVERVIPIVKLILSQVKFRSSSCDYSDMYILVIGTITITEEEANDNARRANEREREVILKNCAPFTDCISEINNTQIDNSKVIDVVMPNNLLEYNYNYSRTSGSL